MSGNYLETGFTNLTTGSPQFVQAPGDGNHSQAS